jgi:hypothetical protein
MFSNTCFALDTDKFYVGMSFSVVIAKKKETNLRFILAILNSNWALNWYYANGKHRGSGVDIGVEKLRNFPLPSAAPNQQATITELVNRIIAAKKKNPGANTSPLENEINQQVHDLYDGLKQQNKNQD